MHVEAVQHTRAGQGWVVKQLSRVGVTHHVELDGETSEQHLFVGRRKVEVGEWVVIWPGGKVRILEDQMFRALYEELNHVDAATSTMEVVS